MYRALLTNVTNHTRRLTITRTQYQPHRQFASTPSITGPSHTALPPHLQSLYGLTRDDVTAILLKAKQRSKHTFADLAKIISHNEVFASSAIYGQHVLTKDEATQLVNALQVDDEYKDDVINELQTIPYRGVNHEDVVSDPVIYRYAEVVKVYGPVLKALIHEHYGDGIMSAIDFSCDFEKVKGSQGENRIKVTLNGKFLPYTKF